VPATVVVRVRTRGRQQVRLQSDGVETRVGRKPPGDIVPASGCGVDARKPLTDVAGKRDLCPPRRELGLP
jgi:hypothetical protein